MTEAEKYTTEMWQTHLGRVVGYISASETQRNAFIDGFNEKPVTGVHHTARGAWERGRHSAVLLGYIPAQTEAERRLEGL